MSEIWMFSLLTGLLIGNQALAIAEVIESAKEEKQPYTMAKTLLIKRYSITWYDLISKALTLQKDTSMKPSEQSAKMELYLKNAKKGEELLPFILKWSLLKSLPSEARTLLANEKVEASPWIISRLDVMNCPLGLEIHKEHPWWQP